MKPSLIDISKCFETVAADVYFGGTGSVSATSDSIQWRANRTKTRLESFSGFEISKLRIFRLSSRAKEFVARTMRIRDAPSEHIMYIYFAPKC